MTQVNSLHLRVARIVAFDEDRAHGYPFRLPLIQVLPSLVFASPVTFFAGENGSGKSTFLEALACAIGSVTVGSQSVLHDPTLAAARELSRHLRLSWTKKTRKGLFLRAEDYFGYVKHLAQTRAELEQDLEEVDQRFASQSDYAKSLAAGVFRGQIHALNARYGRDGLDARSHGESFLDFFHARFVPNGLYLLDEPEAPLSPKRQLGLLTLLKQMVAQGSQFIIATHSPILMAYPGATILEFANNSIAPVAYDDFEHVQVMREFLAKPDRYLRHL